VFKLIKRSGQVKSSHSSNLLVVIDWSQDCRLLLYCVYMILPVLYTHNPGQVEQIIIVRTWIFYEMGIWISSSLISTPR